MSRVGWVYSPTVFIRAEGKRWVSTREYTHPTKRIENVYECNENGFGFNENGFGFNENGFECNENGFGCMKMVLGV